MYPLPRRPSTGRSYALPSRRARRQFACSITTEQPPDTQSHCSCITTQQHFTCDTDLASQACEEMTGPALSPRIEVLTTRQMMGRVPPLTHVEISIKFKSVFLPVSVRQLNLPDRSVRQAAFFPQVVRFCYVIYGNPLPPPALRPTNSLERVIGLRQNRNP